MKRIVLSIMLIFSSSFAVGFIEKMFMTDEQIAEAERIEAEIAKRTKHFFGIEGGVGYYDFASAIVLTTNPLFGGRSEAPTLGYHLGVQGGWQRYDSERRGVRHTFGTKFEWGNHMGKFGGADKSNFSGNNFLVIGMLYYAFDGLFDLSKTDDTHRFGMSLGVEADLGMSLDTHHKEGNKEIFGVGINGRFRFGLYTQVDNNIFDCTLAFPVIGLGFGEMMMPSDVTLSYKRLF